MNQLTQAPELFLLLQESNRVHVRQIQSMQMASSGADTGDQSNQDDRVSGPFGVGFHRGAVDEALLKIIQTPLQNITQLRLMNQATGLVAHRVEVVAQSAGGRHSNPRCSSQSLSVIDSSSNKRACWSLQPPLKPRSIRKT